MPTDQAHSTGPAGKGAKEGESIARSLVAAGRLARERTYTFVVLFVFITLYLLSVRLAEGLLDAHFQRLADAAVLVTDLDRPIVSQIEDRLNSQIRDSGWVRLGGLRVTTLVLASDGITWIYVDGHVNPQPDGLLPTDVLREAVTLLPASAEVNVTLPHNALLSNAILITYAAVVVQILYLHSRRHARAESERIALVMAGRDAVADRARQIEDELEQTRRRLAEVEPAQREFGEEIASLQSERHALQEKLGALARREEELRGKADQAVELAQEVSALEDLLEEAGSDLASKDEEIRDLERNLKRASKTTGKGRSRGSEQMARRLRTLYKTIEFDDRAIDDLVALRDEGMKLKAEEKIKRLSEEAENVSVRRKVGGLPEHLSIFELGFAGKGRIYYTRGRQGRFRVLVIGAKNSQDADMEYLRRLGKDETV